MMTYLSVAIEQCDGRVYDVSLNDEVVQNLMFMTRGVMPL